MGGILSAHFNIHLKFLNIFVIIRQQFDEEKRMRENMQGN